MAAYGEQVFIVSELGQKSRRAALRGFMSLFEPGSIVDIAQAAAPDLM